MQWFLIDKSEQSGPCEEAEIAERIADGRATADTLVRREGEAFWRPLAHTPLGRALITENPSYPGASSPSRARLFLHALMRRRSGSQSLTHQGGPDR